MVLKSTSSPVFLKNKNETVVAPSVVNYAGNIASSQSLRLAAWCIINNPITGAVPSSSTQRSHSSHTAEPRRKRKGNDE